jgi:hypothetical protein
MEGVTFIHLRPRYGSQQERTESANIFGLADPVIYGKQK